MSTNLLNFNKPCNACRRRKVRCDKANPCNNCARHGVLCTYEGQREALPVTPESQQMLQDRVERLESLIQELTLTTAAARSSADGLSSRRSGSATVDSPLASSAYRDLTPTSDERGMVVFEPNVSYYMGPNYWMNKHDFIFEPRCLLRYQADAGLAGNSAWPIASQPSPNIATMATFHLPREKEDLLLELFLKHVEPFIRITHEGFCRREIREFRAGISKVPKEIEAFMFCTQALTVACLPSDAVREYFGEARRELYNRLARAAEIALDRAETLRSRKIINFTALCYYVTAKFVVGDGEIASSLLGIVGRCGTRLGLHRDPSHFSFSPWVAQMRRRMWNYFMMLDCHLFNSEGAESSLYLISDVQPASNTNDDQWTPDRFARPETAPADQDGFTGMTFVLIRTLHYETIWAMYRRSHLMGDDERKRTIDELEALLRRRFINHLAGRTPMEQMTLSYFKVLMAHMRLCFGLKLSELSKETNGSVGARFLSDAIAVLEELERGELVAIQNNWGWIFRWPVTFALISSTLIAITYQPNHPETTRAWRQIDACFQRYNNDEISMARVPAWEAVEKLCDQAMFTSHPSVVHEGTPHAKRLFGASPSSQAHGKSPEGVADTDIQNAIFGDVNMFTDESGMSMPPQMYSSPAPPNGSNSGYFDHWANGSTFSPNTFPPNYRNS